MAYVSRKKCDECHQGFSAVNTQTTCNLCLNRAATEKRKIYFDKLDMLSVEERLRKIEEWIYDYKPSDNSLNTKY